MRSSSEWTALIAFALCFGVASARADQQATGAIGSTVTISVYADGTSPFTYAWAKNGTPISGATSSSYTIPNAQTSDSGNYTAAVTNGLGSTPSDVAMVLIGTAPNITVEPTASTTVSAGADVTFGVVATGTPAPTYQWQINGANLTNGSLTDGCVVSGSQSANLSLTGVGTTESGTYTVIVSNGITPNAVSSNASLTVNGTVPNFTTQPVSQVVGTGSTVTFSTANSGVPAPTYQWFFSSTAISGATGSSLTLSNVTAANNGTYYVVATNVISTATSNNATLTVSTLAPSITSASSGSVIQYSPFSYTITATNSPTSYSATGLPAGLTLNSSTGAITGSDSASGTVSFMINATNSTGTGSIPYTLTVIPATPAISSALSVAAKVNSPFTYTVTATNNPTSFGATGLPPGLSVNTHTGVISGTPTTDGTYTVTISATSVAGTGTAHLAIFVNEAVYTGQYFGTFGSGGTWALNVTPDNTGTFVTNFGGTATVQKISINSQGTFTVAASGIGATSLTQKNSTRVAGSFPITATIVLGSVSGTAGSDTLTGSADIGTSNPVVAGYYVAPAINGGSGGVYSIAGGDGKLFEVITLGTTSDSASGTIGSNSSFSGTTSGGAAVAVTFNSQGQLSETLTPPGSPAVKFFALQSSISSTTRIINLSSRGNVGTGANLLIAGFTIGGSAKSVVVRGVGPALGPFGVSGVLANPQLTLFSGGTVLQSNTRWGGTAALQAAFTQVGAFQFPTSSADSALLSTLASGGYTAQVAGATGGTGIALAEIYDADTAPSPAVRLTNISTRAQVSVGAGNLIAGFVITGNGPETVLIRGIGPTLSKFGLSSVLTNPTLTLFDGSGNVLTSNTGWGGSATLSNAFSQAGAFSLAADSADSAMVVTLEPGSYTAEISPTSGSGGVALVEIYELP